jgi:hypothetical protein
LRQQESLKKKFQTFTQTLGSINQQANEQILAEQEKARKEALKAAMSTEARLLEQA